MSETPLAEADLAVLVDAWLEWSEVADQLHVPTSRVPDLVRAHRLAAAVPPGRKGQHVPAAFLQDGEVVKGLPGLLTVLHDAGFDDRECIAWLFLDQGFPGRGIDALRENRGSEVKRRAQALGF